jgi:hypothetical protein
MKKKLLFVLIVCLGFIAVLSIPNVSKSGSLMIGNIEAFSQNELPEQGKRKVIITNKKCDIIIDNEKVGEGVYIDCEEGEKDCFRNCLEPY